MVPQWWLLTLTSVFCVFYEILWSWLQSTRNIYWAILYVTFFSILAIHNVELAEVAVLFTFYPVCQFRWTHYQWEFDLTDSFSSSRTQPYAGSDGYVNNLLDGKEHTFRQFCWASRKEQQQRWGKQLRAAWELIPSSRLYAKIIQIIDRLVKRGLSAT